MSPMSWPFDLQPSFLLGMLLEHRRCFLATVVHVKQITSSFLPDALTKKKENPFLFFFFSLQNNQTAFYRSAHVFFFF